MADKISDKHLAPLPESLRKQLEKFKKDLWRIKVTEAVLAGLLGLLISFGLVFAIDRVWEMPGIVRLLVLIVGVSLFAIFAPLWINRWVFKHRRENQLANLISKSYPKLGDRLLGVVELQDQKESQTALSPELREAAMIAVAHEAQNHKLDKAISSTWRNKLAIGALVSSALCALGFIFYPSAGKNALKRWIMPLADTERFTFTKFDTEHIPDPLYVAIDEPFQFSLPLAEDTEKTPTEMTARYGAGNTNAFPLKGNQFDLSFKGQRAKGNIYLKSGDANLQFTVHPIKRPKLSKIKGSITYPDYLMREPIDDEFIAGQLEVLAGSKLQIEVIADRPLQSAQVGPITTERLLNEAMLEEAEIQGIAPSDIPLQDIAEITHKIDINSILPEAIEIREKQFTIPISWTDEYGIEGLTATELSITPTLDLTPTTYIKDAKKQVFILHTEVLSFEFFAEDDYGIKAAGIEWQGSFSSPSTSIAAVGEERYLIGDPYMQDARESVDFDFDARQIMPQKLNIRTWVEDYNPSTPRSYSKPIEVFLLTESEHADYLKNQMKDALSELEDAMRNEQENLDENKRIEKQLKDPELAAEAKKKIENQALKEKDNQDEVKKLAEKMEDLFKEALKNKNIDPKTLKDISEAAEQMTEMADKEIPEISKKLDDAQSEKNSSEKTEQDLKEAIEKQEQLVEKMKETAKKADDANKKLESSTFVNRLKQTASDEEEVAAGLLPEDGVISAAHYSDLDPVRQRLLQTLFLLQEQAEVDLRWIEEDLRFFHSRTQNEVHKTVIEEMQEQNLTEKLQDTKNHIEAARVFVPMSQALQAADQLRKWAQLLDGSESGSNGGGEGGGGGSDSQEDQDFEFNLRVLKMIQQEQHIRDKTRALEQLKRNAGIESETLPNPEQSPKPAVNNTPQL